MSPKRRVGILLIGAGRYALAAHWPVVREMMEHPACAVDIIGVLDFKFSKKTGRGREGRRSKAEAYFYKEHERKIDGFYKSIGKKRDDIELPLPEEWKTATPTDAQVQQELDKIEKLQRGAIEENHERVAAIVSTPAIAHKQYVAWALKRGYHVLVDKPLHIPLNCSVRQDCARGVWLAYEELAGLARRGQLLMLATQKRYSDAFRKMAGWISDVCEKTHVKAIPSIAFETNDGYWVTKYQGQRFSYEPHKSGGGKISHSGYHVLDIVPWLMRHGGVVADSADVYARFWRPRDAFWGFPKYRMRGNGWVRGSNIEPREDLSEINADIHITFLYRGAKVSMVMIKLLHEGVSSDKGRVKTEYLSLHLGPTAALYYQRTAKLDSALSEEACGGTKHRSLTFIRNKGVLKRAKVIEYIKDIKEEDDKAPARDFLEAVCCAEDLTDINARVCSSFHDHVIGVKLMSAAYESGTFDLLGETPRVVRVTFDPARDWRTPPGH